MAWNRTTEEYSHPPIINIVHDSGEISKDIHIPEEPVYENIQLGPVKRNFQLPYTHDEAISVVGHRLTAFELHEIKRFSEIYFTGTNCKKIQAEMSQTGPGYRNHRFDDENDNYIIVPHDHILYRYQIIGKIGEGTFCKMIKAYDHKRRRFVAIKMIRNNEYFNKLLETEISILEKLRSLDEGHKTRVVHILGYFSFRGHRMVTFELLHCSLYDIIKKRQYQGLDVYTVITICVEILKCLTFLGTLGLVHCDLKPENVMLIQEGSWKLKVL